ncbi:hypothetical protein P4B35_20845 [Pontiellaceae bacterium B12227]|nr:hypothetical protein [Pontiellaceae bacterium B12227]
MKKYEKVTFEPTIALEDADEVRWFKENAERLVWIEKVACVVLNHQQTDDFVRPTRILEILENAGRKDLHGYPVESDNGELLYSRWKRLFSMRLHKAMQNNDRLFLPKIVICRHEEDIPMNGFDEDSCNVWYHFFADPEIFNYSTEDWLY